MRLFAGIPVVDDARREVLALLGRLRESDWPVRWVHDEGLHLTLKFFGEVAPERLDVIEEAVR
ncbi:MAG TPA: 2'-5' RNA ligase family protein, partial [Solirubrobacterales bacterium]|nr:2'-5' RNA ligase family protein [Solirubrobacterales bacterium]